MVLGSVASLRVCRMPDNRLGVTTCGLPSRNDGPLRPGNSKGLRLMNIFWSWQSDSPGKTGRHFVHGVLSELLLELSDECGLREAERSQLDHDTKDVTGWVAIAETVFQKIEQAAAFVADMTLTAETPAGKKCPNPNVLIELGYALKALGDASILLVWNTANGATPGDLPFDMRHRRSPIAYHLTDNATAAEIKEQTNHLKKNLRGPLKVCIELALKQRDAQRQFARQAARPGDPSIWTGVGEPIEGYSVWNQGRWTRFAVHESARSYVRMVPFGWLGAKPGQEAVAKCCEQTWRLGPLHEPHSDSAGLAMNARGLVSVLDCEYPVPTTISATQWFEENGEVWSFDAGILDEQAGLRRIDGQAIAANWRLFIRETAELYRDLAATFPIVVPIRIDVGVTGLVNACWRDAAPDVGGFIGRPGNQFAKAPEFHHSTVLRTLDDSAIDPFLAAASRALADHFGAP